MRATSDVMSVGTGRKMLVFLGLIQPGQSVNLKENKSEFRIQKRTLTT
jgi:hypothetical protein